MRVKIVSNYRRECDTEVSVTEEIVPVAGDEVIWFINGSKMMMRGTVKKRIINYTIQPEVLKRNHRFDVTLEMEATEPAFEVPDDVG